jgi:hypothetical protein
MLEKARDSPVQRLPDWRLTLPLAQSCRPAGRVPAAAHRANRRQCKTADVGCTAGRVRGLAPRKDWSGCDAPTHGTASILRNAAG